MIFHPVRSLRVKTFLTFLLLLTLTSISYAAEQATAVYESALFNEDVTWRGSVLIKGSVVVAPQATLRIEPGTTVRFAPGAARQAANLVVQGRIQAVGTAERPIVLTSDRSKPARGAWGGVVLLATEKKNIMERCRIEYADVALAVHFSTLTMKNITIAQAHTGLLAHDGVVQMSGSSLSDTGVAIEVHTSEFDGRDVTISGCQRGFVVNKSALVLAAAKVTNCLQSAVEAEESRIKISGSDFSSNAVGVRIMGGEGQLLASRFTKNRDTALHLTGVRLKVQRCLFADNAQDALRVEDGRALLFNNAFTGNGGYNLYNAGHETVSARQNWWGTSDSSAIGKKIYDAAQDKKSGTVYSAPWLADKPPLTP